ARPRPDLEHFLGAFQSEQLQVVRMNVRLRNRLSVTDWQRRVFIRAMPNAGRHELMPRNLLERTQDGQVANALRANVFDEAESGAPELRFYNSFHHVRASCRSV